MTKIIISAIIVLVIVLSLNVIAMFSLANKMQQLLVDPINGEGNPMLGSSDAKVSIIEFSDFQCPYCARFHQQVFPQIMEKYIKTGKANFMYFDFPLPFHKNARAAAVAANCADEQGKYWEYHDMIFQNQDNLEGQSLMDFAKTIGLDTNKFSVCMRNNKGESIDSDIAVGKRLGVTGTPAFFINGQLIEGSQPFSVFEQIIDEELAK